VIPTTDHAPISILHAGFRPKPLENSMITKHLNQIDLANRWKLSPRTLERWRWAGEGPRFMKLGGRVVYRLEDIEEYEREQSRAGTTDTPAKPAA
jgi:hypothetical protein